MSKTTISASAIALPGKDETPNSLCRVAQLAQDADAITKAHGRADAKQAETSGKKEIALEVQMRVLSEKLDGIEKAAAMSPTNSAIGAMFQLCLIKDLVDLIGSWVPEESERVRECDEARKAIVRMCYSIRDYLGANTGAKPEDACGEYFMSEKYNPHRAIAAAIAETDAADD